MGRHMCELLQQFLVFFKVLRLMARSKESDIVLDLVTCNSDRLPSWNKTLNNHALEIQSRAKSIGAFSVEMADIFDACRAYPDVNWRFYVQAPTDLPGTAASFDKSAMEAMVSVGLQDAANASVGIHCSQ